MKGLDYRKLWYIWDRIDMDSKSWDTYQILPDRKRKNYIAKNGVVFKVDLKDGTAYGDVVSVDHRQSMLTVIEIIEISLDGDVPTLQELKEMKSERGAVIPPFSSRNSFFRNYGISEKIGKCDNVPLFDDCNVLVESTSYNPFIREYVPERYATVRLSPPLNERRKWKMFFAQDGEIVKRTDDSQLGLRVQPRNLYGIGSIDLFLGRAVAARRQRELPRFPKNPPEGMV
jgi:hypothetical protein